MRRTYTLPELKRNINRIIKGKASSKEIEGWLLAAFTNYKNRSRKKIWNDGRGVGLQIIRNLRKSFKSRLNQLRKQI